PPPLPAPAGWLTSTLPAGPACGWLPGGTGCVCFFLCAMVFPSRNTGSCDSSANRQSGANAVPAGSRGVLARDLHCHETSRPGKILQGGADYAIAAGVRRLRRVIDEVVRKELFENIEVPPVLDLLGTPADDGFRRISCHTSSSFRTHCLDL